MLSSKMYALMGDVVETAEVATATGIAGMFGYLGGALFTLTVGALANTIGYERCSPFCSCSTSWPQSSCGLLWACEDPALWRNSSSDAPVEPAGWHARVLIPAFAMLSNRWRRFASAPRVRNEGGRLFDGGLRFWMCKVSRFSAIRFRHHAFDCR